MAERLVLELKDKVLKLERRQEAARERAVPRSAADAVKEDALSALINLGYKNALAREVIEKIIDEEQPVVPSLDVLLKKALQRLSG